MSATPGLLRRQARQGDIPGNSQVSGRVDTDQNGSTMSTESSGARLYDEHNRDRGWASRVVRRANVYGRLVVLDVTTTDPALLAFLRALDTAPLRIEEAGPEGAHYRFAWASGYENGTNVRVRGNLRDV